MKRIAKYTSLAFIFTFILFISVISDTASPVSAAIREGDILNHNKVSTPKSSDVASSKYAVIARFIRGTSKLELTGANAS